MAIVAENERKAREAAEAENKRLRDLADAKAKEDADAKAAEAERLRLAALAPDKEKVSKWMALVWSNVLNAPEVQDKELARDLNSCHQSIKVALDTLKRALE